MDRDNTGPQQASATTVHQPVMVSEVLHWLAPKPGTVIVDATVGGGGHARAIAELLGPEGLLVGIDRDPSALPRAEAALASYPHLVRQGNYADLPEILAELDIPVVDGVLLDLGLCSDQLLDHKRGFSFDSSGPLDMRFDPSAGEPAFRLVNRLSESRLADLIYRYGEEPASRRIARAIVTERQRQPIRTASQLAEIIRRAIGRKGSRIDPATRTFQALRIAVNEELKWLEIALRRIPEVLRPGGRLVVLSYHSLEDRLVKEAFRNDSRLKALTPHPVTPSAQEVADNPRARSAKLRAAERIV
ncbi:MAG: 16S rRNA (cytosine(1402)-N(4))-methyltransferase RsmH [Thermoguttaceae bacterium]|nr:16S rRNA (cytosine(1402)-N(4))-methyltransferase RsmH [Thermoguttaceae bacterium]MDW8078919.1 16S rRNA (cytosine(1402)-N(4))-methyltransferase RsmH [Thermoguttaceae bacterium]